MEAAGAPQDRPEARPPRAPRAPHLNVGTRPRDVAVVVSATAATRARWTEGLTCRGVSSVHECRSLGEAGSLLGSLGRGVLVLVDATGAAADPGAGPPPTPGRGERLVILAPPEPAAALAGLGSGARAVLFQRRDSPVGDSAGSEDPATGLPGTDHRATGELGGYPVSTADGAAAWLTWREVEVLRHVADGLDNKRIGELLGLSALTVKSHLARASRRLGARDRGHLVLLALRAAVIS